MDSVAVAVNQTYTLYFVIAVVILEDKALMFGLAVLVCWLVGCLVGQFNIMVTLVQYLHDGMTINLVQISVG